MPNRIRKPVRRFARPKPISFTGVRRTTNGKNGNGSLALNPISRLAIGVRRSGQRNGVKKNGRLPPLRGFISRNETPRSTILFAPNTTVSSQSTALVPAPKEAPKKPALRKLGGVTDEEVMGIKGRVAPGEPPGEYEQFEAAMRRIRADKKRK